jgi:hypothetical protein
LLNRKRMTLETSSGSPSRLNAVLDPRASNNSSLLPIPAVIGVWIMPLFKRFASKQIYSKPAEKQKKKKKKTRRIGWVGGWANNGDRGRKELVVLTGLQR